ncbi:hypothetical protein Hanom_Chr03g00180131 [Helianthus anomalus]
MRLSEFRLEEEEYEKVDNVNAAELVGKSTDMDIGSGGTFSHSNTTGEQNQIFGGAHGSKSGGSQTVNNLFHFKSTNKEMRPKKRTWF